jgi:hypothetical protein
MGEMWARAKAVALEVKLAPALELVLDTSLALKKAKATAERMD